MKKKLTQNEIKNKLQDLLDEIEDNEQDEESLKEVTEQIEEKVKGTYKKPKKGFVVSAVLYPLLILFLALLLGLLSMSDTRKRILDKMKLEIGDSLFDDGECSCETLSSKLDYLLQHGVGGGTSYSNNGAAVSVNGYETDGNLPNVGNNIGNIAVITDVEIANYYLSSVVPKEPRNGTVWIVQDRNSEYYLTSDTSKLGISYAMQYICDEGGSNCEWQIKKAYYFDNAKWNLLYYVPVSNGEVDLSGADVNAKTTYEYGYTGKYQTFHAPFSGIYEVELWGAAGGMYDNNSSTYTSRVGTGAYTKGEIYLNAGTTLYIYVGGQGASGYWNTVLANSSTAATASDNGKISQGGWNGGGYGAYHNTSWWGNGGGGATDIRLVPTEADTDWGKDNFNSLKSRIMVAAGGSGEAYWNGSYGRGANGGMLEGEGGHADNYTEVFTHAAKGGTQTLGGTGSYHRTNQLYTGEDGGFGYGGHAASYRNSGGGGGYYGGGGGGSSVEDAGNKTGGSGSSYISGYEGCNSIDQDSTANNIKHTGSAYHYSGYFFTNTEMSKNGSTKNGSAKIVLKSIQVKSDDVLKEEKTNDEKVWSYTYANDYQIFEAPLSGTYKIEAWGASGGAYNTRSYANYAGKGAYTKGEIYLRKGTKFYIYVGGQGGMGYANATGWSGYSTNYSTGGYNGGGNGTYHSDPYYGNGGGGATDIRLVSGSETGFESLKSRIMVAAGGGGAAANNSVLTYGGDGGTLEGLAGHYNDKAITYPNGLNGATQSLGGIAVFRAQDNTYNGVNGRFGIGGDAAYYHTSGAGGGYYGGGGGGHNDSKNITGGGGSSYISGYEGCDSVSETSTAMNIVHTGSAYHYSGYYFTNTNMVSGQNYSDGKAQVTLVNRDTKADDEVNSYRNDNDTGYNFYYTGDYQTFTAPKTGTYQIELWGASGGYFSDGTKANTGKGAYTTGEIYLKQNDTLYVYVGGHGGDYTRNAYGLENSYSKYYSTGGYNGGGVGTYYVSGSTIHYGTGGGGATDIRLVSGDATSFDSLKSRIMVAAGGSGSSYISGYEYYGADGGTLTGNNGRYRSGEVVDDRFANISLGGTQTLGGKGASRPDQTNDTHTGASGQFGLGGAAAYYHSSGGGGGYYGGGGGGHNWKDEWVTGAGGSSYISGHEGCNSLDENSTDENLIHTGSAYHYSGKYFTSTSMTSGINFGNGKAKITLINKDSKTEDQLISARTSNEKTWSYTYQGKYQEFTAPRSGIYQIDAYGASGGWYDSTSKNNTGKGAHTTGNIYLNEGDKLYIYVGGEGGSGYANAKGWTGNSTYYSKGGYNGGGNGTYYSTSYWGNGGGGATDIRLESGDSQDFESLKSRIMVASGGSGTSNLNGTLNYGANGGTLEGKHGRYSSSFDEYLNSSEGGTQTLGGRGSFREDYLNTDRLNHWGKDGGFGYGGDGANSHSSGAGGGYYGGGGGGHNWNNNWVTGGGGSSYISGYDGCNSIDESSSEDNIVHTGSAYHYSGKYFTSVNMQAGENTGNGKAIIKLISTTTKSDDQLAVSKLNSIKEWNYTYQGDYQIFKAPKSGIYKIEAWGASGGTVDYSRINLAGKGAYTSGNIYLNADDTLYIYVGGHGGNSYYNARGWNGVSTYYSTGGYNGGGVGIVSDTNYYGNGGGGATDIRLVSGDSQDFDSLKSRIMVAAGGSGAQYEYNGNWYYGAAGGTLEGEGGHNNTVAPANFLNASGGGTQTIGGQGSFHSINNNWNSNPGTFGKGGNGSYNRGSGGGGGYYGGAGGGHNQQNGITTGGGGSSYISGYEGCNSITEDSSSNHIEHTGSAYHYSGRFFSGAYMSAGENYGNGKAKITFVTATEKTTEDLNSEKLNTENVWNYTYQGDYQTFTAPKSGTYKIETWGASGGVYSTSQIDRAGKGAYAEGNIYLNKGETLYVYVGGHGSNGYNTDTKSRETTSGYISSGGYNGGGYGSYQDGNYFGQGGGGATDIRLVSGDSQDFESLKSRIMVAAGGSGAHYEYNGNWYYGASGGELVGDNGHAVSLLAANYLNTAEGGTQTLGGKGAFHSTDVNWRGHDGSFGKGGDAAYNRSSGGGAGYYGGGGGGHNQQNGIVTGGGGSSYISGYDGCNSIDESSVIDHIVHTGSAYHYSGKYFDTSSVIEGNNYGNGKAKITLVQAEVKTDGQLDSVKVNKENSWNYTYQGDYQIFTAPKTGLYQIETWGASGGYYAVDKVGYAGKGAYAKGQILLEAGTRLYVYVGGHGGNGYYTDSLSGSTQSGYISAGGYNGGGFGSFNDTNYFGQGGGGATDIRLLEGTSSDFESLKSRIMVAAGGSGAEYVYNGNWLYGVGGGALNGNYGRYTNLTDPMYVNADNGATQMRGGIAVNRADQNGTHTGVNGTFGIGGNSSFHYSSGGGGGYYGGGGGGHNYSNNWITGGSGSSYISGYEGCNSVMEESTVDNIKHTGNEYHYSGYYFTDTIMEASENLGNGKALITFIREEDIDAESHNQEINNETSWNYTYTGNYQKFVAPKTGTYEVTLNGAQGGYNTHAQKDLGGLGATTKGDIYLEAGTTLYIYVGGHGGNSVYNSTGWDGYSTYYSKGGYNGGGNGTFHDTSYYGNSGGGATDIRLVSGDATSFESLKSRIMVAAGGGGSSYNNNAYNYGGYAGGLVGSFGRNANNTTNYYNSAQGGTQSGGGKGTYRADYDYHTAKSGEFGYGGDGAQQYGGAGGGGGYFGGGGGGHSYQVYVAGAGGSSYISGHEGCSSIVESSTSENIIMSGNAYHYSGYYFTGTSLQTGTTYGDGSAQIKLISTEAKTDDVPVGTTFEYRYSGNYQTFIAPQTGYYSMQLWGAAGGTYDQGYEPTRVGAGAYTSGRIYLTKGTTLFVYVGGRGGMLYFNDKGWNGYSTYYSKGGWNGGGNGMYYSTSYWGNGGGGATDIRTLPTSKTEEWNEVSSLASRIMVAAGGSGSVYIYNGNHHYGAPGGGLVGYDGRTGSNLATANSAKGGTQTSGGVGAKNGTNLYGKETHTGANGGFGFGGTGAYYHSSGAGGGWYGGGGGGNNASVYVSGGSGSSYISGHAGCVGVTSSGSANNTSYEQLSDSISYTNYKFTNTNMIDGLGYRWTTVKSESAVLMPTFDGEDTMVGNYSDGFAKITFVGAE